MGQTDASGAARNQWVAGSEPIRPVERTLTALPGDWSPMGIYLELYYAAKAGADAMRWVGICRLQEDLDDYRARHPEVWGERRDGYRAFRDGRELPR